MTELKTKTVYDYELLKELQMIAGDHFAPKVVKKKKNESFAYGVLFICAGIYIWNKWQFAEALILCELIGALLAFRGMFYYPFTAFVADKMMKSHQRVSMFEFGEDAIKAISSQGSSSRYTYERCSDLLETQRGFYFFMDGSGVVMEKQYVVGGTQDDLRRFLEEKTGQTFQWFGKAKG